MARSTSPSGRPTKAERLLKLTSPYGLKFPLDEDIVADLQNFPGEMPRSARHWIRLLPDPQVPQT